MENILLRNRFISMRDIKTESGIIPMYGDNEGKFPISEAMLRSGMDAIQRVENVSRTTANLMAIQCWFAMSIAKDAD